MTNVMKGRIIHWLSSIAIRDTVSHRKYYDYNKFKCCSYLTSQHSFHTSYHWYKKRKTPEEKAVENTGRRILRYTPKSKSKVSVIEIWKNMTVLDVANSLNEDIDHVFEAMMYIDKSDGYNKKSSIIDNIEVIKRIVKISGRKFKFVLPPDERKTQEILNKDAVKHPPPPIENLKVRPPVVTVMGHVDHGKTTLLDSLRNTSVVDREFGGITQHIGAFSVTLKSGDLVTFLDTPGHAAFTAMRARGANVTDMVVLVVAADDGVMEQTLESIRMAKEAGVPMIVAINKIDKPKADIEAAKQMLSRFGVLVEDLGGDVQSVPISALKQTNLDRLVEAIGAQAQIMNLKADPTGPVEGVVIEAQTDPRRGKLVTVIVQRGTMKCGSILVAGMGWARVRTMLSESGEILKEALPSTPVQVLGWKELPSAGDDMIEVPSEKRANEVMRWRQNLEMQKKQDSDSMAIAAKNSEHQEAYTENLQKKRLLGRYKVRRVGPRPKLYTETNETILHIVIKGDVDGSVEAILDVLDTYDEHDVCKLDIVHFGIGNVTETDIELAETFDALLYTFNVEVPKQLDAVLNDKKVSIRPHNVIYKMVDEIKKELNIRIPIIQEEKTLGEATVQQNFIITEGKKKVMVAGCRCVSGLLKKKSLYRIMRDGINIHDGDLSSMKHLKNEVDSIKNGLECGLRFSDNSLELEPGDKVICYEMVDLKRETKWNPGF